MFKFSRFARFARPSMARNPGRHQTNIQTRLMTKIYFGPGSEHDAKTFALCSFLCSIVDEGYGGRTTYNKYLWAFPIATFALGTWQVYRWRWKLGVIALREVRQRFLFSSIVRISTVHGFVAVGEVQSCCPAIGGAS